jgi:hypothetical protein
MQMVYRDVWHPNSRLKKVFVVFSLGMAAVYLAVNLIMDEDGYQALKEVTFWPLMALLVLIIVIPGSIYLSTLLKRQIDGLPDNPFDE